MTRIHSGTPIPRHFVYVTSDGAFVVRLSETRSQDLLSGDYRIVSDSTFGHPITDYELNQLKAAGIAEQFNQQYVWLFALPETHQFDPSLHTYESAGDRQRLYYVNTALPKSQMDTVRAVLSGVGLLENVTVEIRGGQVAICGKEGRLFTQMREAEAWQRQLSTRVPNLFRESVVAFTETEALSQPLARDTRPLNGASIDLDLIIASQTDITLTHGKEAVLLLNQPEEQQAIEELCTEMRMVVWSAQTGQEALQLLEDGHTDLLIMDLNPPDMHGWAMLGKVKEIDGLRNLPIIVIAEHGTPNQQSMALVVAKVDVYLVRPISKARLRQNIWMVVHNRQR